MLSAQYAVIPRVSNNGEIEWETSIMECPECASRLTFWQGDMVCKACGWSKYGV